jgi:hypothetical protein
MINEPKYEGRRVVAVLGAKDLALVDEVATADGVSREEAVLQLLRLELARHTSPPTVH